MSQPERERAAARKLADELVTIHCPKIYGRYLGGESTFKAAVEAFHAGVEFAKTKRKKK